MSFQEAVWWINTALNTTLANTVRTNQNAFYSVY
jgi:hypothetical protein